MPSILPKSLSKMLKDRTSRNSKDKAKPVDVTILHSSTDDYPEQDVKELGNDFINVGAALSDSSSHNSYVHVDKKTASLEQGRTRAQRRRERSMTKYNRQAVNQLGYDTFDQLRKKRFGGGVLLDVWKTVIGGGKRH